MTGLADKPARSLVGRLLKPLRDDCAQLLAVIAEARDLRPVEPAAWLQAAVAHRSADKPGAMDALRAEWDLPALRYADDPDPKPARLLQ